MRKARAARFWFQQSNTWVRADIAIMQTPDGNGRLELVKFHSPSKPGPDGIIIELAEQIG